jgi:tRNA threonylcarbamoyladenosine biosynthesis protein TsaE
MCNRAKLKPYDRAQVWQFISRRASLVTVLDLPSDDDTLDLGRRLAGLLRAGDVIALKGELGAGKTTLARAIIQSLHPGETVPSPTYTLVQPYESETLTIYHYDLYRLQTSSELDELGWDAAQSGATLVEWPEKAGGRLPAERLEITLEILGEARRATLAAIGKAWQTRLDDL